MSKFIINCPICNRPIEASTNMFSKKNIKCICGYLVNVELNKIATKECSYCGNKSTYNRGQEDTATCSSCGEKLFSRKKIKFTCPNCLKSHSAFEGTKTYKCSQCDTIINVQSRYLQEQSIGKIALIQWNTGLNNIFIYKHPIERFNTGSQLIVTEGQKAIFFCDGKGLDVFGPGRYTLETHRLPMLDKTFNIGVDTDHMFQSEVYFIRTNRLRIPWSVLKISLEDKKMGFYIDFGCSGSFEAQVLDDDSAARRLLYMVINSTVDDGENKANATTEYSVDYIVKKFNNYIETNIQDLLSNILLENSISILDIDLKKNIIEEMLRQRLNDRVLMDYGMYIPKNMFAIPYLKIHNQQDVSRWRNQVKDKVLNIRDEEFLMAELEERKKRQFVEVQTEQGINIIKAAGEAERTRIASETGVVKAKGEADSIKILSEAESVRIKNIGDADASVYSAQAKAEAQEMRDKNYTYQQETTRIIGKEAMKNGMPGTQGSSISSTTSSIINDMVGFGVSIHATKEILKDVKDNLSPLFNTPNINDIWNCTCGLNEISSNFCPNCGKSRINNSWNCECGTRNISSAFCPNCGKKRG